MKQELTEHGLVPEEWGGKTAMVPISAKKGNGVDSLLETVGWQPWSDNVTAQSRRRVPVSDGGLAALE